MNPTTLTSKNITLIYTPAINYAFHQNHVSILRELILSNSTESEWKNIKVEIIPEPDFMQGWKGEVTGLAVRHSNQTIPNYLNELKFNLD